MKMIKKIMTSVLCTLILFTTIMISCSKDENPNTAFSSIDFEMFGIEHNKMLTEYYNSSEPNLKKSEYIAKLDVLIKENVDVLSKKNSSSKVLNKTLNKAYESKININSALYEGYGDKISDRLKDKLDKLDDILMQQGLEHQNRISLIMEWENDVKNDINLVENEKYIALVGSSVSRYSIEFWTQNIYDVSNKVSTNKKVLNKSAGWFDDLLNYSVGCWKEDAKGAVVVAVAVSVETGGLGAPMGIVGGAVAGSALYHIDQLF